MAKKYDDALLVADYEKCKRCRIVAEKYGCSEETVRRALVRYGVPRTNNKAKAKPVPTGKNYYEKRSLYSDSELIDAYSNSNSSKEAGAKLGVSYGTVLRALKRNGIKVRKQGNGGGGSPTKITDEQLVEAVKTMTRQEIAEMYGIHIATLDRRMGRLGIHAVKQARRASFKRSVFGECWHYVDSHRLRFEELQPGFEYIESRSVSRYVRRVRMKCRKCGNVVERDQSTARKKHICCDKCENERKLLESRTLLLRVIIAVSETKRPKTCKECGEVFNSPYNNQAYCSNSCKNKAKGKGRSVRSRCRKYGVRYDSSVKPRLVFERDEYVCQICGKPTDPDDTSWGTHGPMYPTVDHIIALKNGGSHTWGNVQCAHAICNSYKRDLWTDEYKEALECLA